MSKESVSSLITSSPAYMFAADVIGGKTVSGKRRMQACQRFIDELDKSLNADYPWEFDVAKGYRPIDFMEKFLIPTKGDYKKMTLLPWQHFVEANLYGWVNKKTKYRRFQSGLILVGEGNGKSTLIAGNATYAASKDGERGAEVYCLANSRDQARIIFGECSAQVKASPVLSKHFKVTRDGIYFPKTNSKIQPLASDSKNLDGRNVHVGIFDEIHEFRNYKLINVIEGKKTKRKQPLIIFISTFGTVIDGPLMDKYILGCQILDNTGAISQRASERMFIYIDEIDERDDPDDSSCWGKANPSLGTLLQLDDLVDKWEKAKLVPAERVNFINKQLNVFAQADELSFLTPQIIRANNQILDVETLKGMRCFGGFDLSETGDFTSACLEFPLLDRCYFVLEHSWVPIKKVKEDKEKLDWRHLTDSGVLTVVDGEYVDYDLVLQWLVEQSRVFRIESIGYDPAKSIFLIHELEKVGFTLSVVRQGEITLTGPLDDLKERFIDGKIIHNNNPLFNWYLGNVKLTKRSVNSTYLPTKQNKNRKIDGFAALLDAHTEYLRKNPEYIPPDKPLTTKINLKNLKQ